MTPLEERWPLAAHTELRDRLIAAYAAPQRGYHDTRHLSEVLDHLATLLPQPGLAGVDRDAVLLAAWFHDAVYDGRPDDEERSAVLAERELPAAGVPTEQTAEVARLVRLTRDHRPAPDDPAGEVLCDADLAILAAAPARYDEYVRDVRREYAHLDDETFRTGRTGVLRALLAKPALFHTPLARESWERAARDNVTRELEALSAPGPA